MLGFIARRIIMSVFVVFLVTVIVFLLLQLVPGDVAYYVLGIDATQEQIDALRSELLLDRSLIVQYVHWFTETISGNFGESVIYHRDVSVLISTRLPITLHLAFGSLIIGTLLGIVAGMICAIRRGGILDSIITLVANTGMATPIFWVGILCIYFFGLKLGWLPIQGYTSLTSDFWMSTKQTIMPILCMAIPPIAFLARQTRSSMLEVISQDYVRTAWAKGLSESSVVIRHVMKNGFIPIVTFIGIGLSHVVGGSVLIETVFNIPGMGRMIVQAALNKDMIVVQACALMIALLVVLANLMVDISYGYIDPRIHYD